MAAALAARLERWRAFYDFGQPAPSLLLIRLDENNGRPWPHPDRQRERIEWAWQKYVKQRDRLRWLDDDTLPYLDLYTGTEIFAEAFGCRVHRPANDMPFALPRIKTAAEVAGLSVPPLDTPCLARLFEMADELRARAGAEALVRLPDIQSPLDIAALIWEKSSFYIALLEAPEAVRELESKAKQLLAAFLDAWFARYGSEFIAHYPDYYMPRGLTLSEDEIGAVSRRIFEALFLPELAELSNRYGGIGIHCCANARHQWSQFKRIPGLKLLNLVQPFETLKEATRYFAPVTPQMHTWGEVDLLALLEQLPREARLVLEVQANSTAQATELSHRLREALAQRST